MIRKIIAQSILIFICSTVTISAQDTQKEAVVTRTDLGFSVQAYPAGIIPTVTLERYLQENTSLFFRLGGNFTDRQDFSDENDNEEGEGFGASAGYRKHFPMKKGKIVAGLNLDVWNLWIDWSDNIDSPPETFGSTYTLVLQPWLEVGYFLPIKNSASQLGVTLGFGREINIITDGEDVAQDWIGSLSVHYQFSVKK